MRKDLEKIKQKRLNEKRVMKDGNEAIIIEYNNCNDIKIKFVNTNEIIKTSYSNFKKVV